MNIPLKTWNGSDETEKLRLSIEQFNTATSAQTQILVRLTWALAVMTLLMTVGVGAQIWLAFR